MACCIAYMSLFKIMLFHVVLFIIYGVVFYFVQMSYAIHLVLFMSFCCSLKLSAISTGSTYQ